MNADMYTMFSNKLYVASTPKIYRRVKDFYDIHSIINSEVYPGKMQFNTLANRFRSLYKIDTNEPLEFFKEDYYDKLKHAYMQNSLFEDKEDFDSFSQDTVKFIQIFYMECIVR